MPIERHVDAERHRIHTVATGEIDAEAVRAHIRGEVADGILGLPELIDGRGVRLLLSTAEVRELVELLHRHGNADQLGPVAVVVEADCAYGILRMLEILSEGVCDVRPFRLEAEAREWLDGKTPTPPAPVATGQMQAEPRTPR